MLAVVRQKGTAESACSGAYAQHMASRRDDERATATIHVAQPELGDQLKAMFGEMTAGPMPSRLLELADRLEDAFQRGELFDCATRRPRAS